MREKKDVQTAEEKGIELRSYPKTEYQSGLKYLNGNGVEKDSTKAVGYFRVAAERGEASAEFYLGQCYSEGEGVEKDIKEAVRWFQLSADKGNADAQANLGIHYLIVEKNPERAVKYLKPSAEAGNTIAQFYLGKYLIYGTETTKDQTEGVRFLQLAANKKYPAAFELLGYCYSNGKGIKQNSEKAESSYLEAAKLGSPSACSTLGFLYMEKGDKSPRKSLEFYGQAIKFFEEAAKQNYPDALNILTLIYLYGYPGYPETSIIKKDFSKAFERCQASAGANDPVGQYFLGHCYEQGKGVKVNLVEAARLYGLSEGQGNQKARVALGNCYEKGKGVDKDIKQAVRLYKESEKALRSYKPDKWELPDIQCRLGNCLLVEGWVDAEYNRQEAMRLFRLAGDKKFPKADYYLGRCYMEGLGVKKDTGQAVKYYSKGADQNDENAQNALGYCYLHGIGVTRDESKAIHLFTLAAEGGCVKARVNLGHCFQHGASCLKIDLKKAAENYRIAAEQGDPEAQNVLGECYEKGIGVDKNLKEAARLYQLAAKQEFADAEYNLARCYVLGKGVTLDKSKAVDLCKRVCDRGRNYEHKAINLLGTLYAKGVGVAKNVTRAKTLYELSAVFYNKEAAYNALMLEEDSKDKIEKLRILADSGCAMAQCELGDCYAWGVSLTQDIFEAIKYYEFAAKQGLSRAQISLGDLYARGKGVSKDIDKAIGYYQSAANQENTHAQFELGLRYKRGDGVPKDDRKALRLLLSAGELYSQGNEIDYIGKDLIRANQAFLEICYLDIPEQYRDDRRKQAEIQFTIGYRYEHGAEGGINLNLHTALNFYEESSRRGNLQATARLMEEINKPPRMTQTELKIRKELEQLYDQQKLEQTVEQRVEKEEITAEGCFTLGIRYLQGNGVEEDKKTAIAFLRLSAGQGHSVAQNRLGLCYLTGDGVIQDAKKAVIWFRAASDQNNQDAQNNLANCYLKGEGISRSEREAVALYKQAAEKGDANAQNHLAFCYKSGIGVPEDSKEAARLYRLAADQGQRFLYGDGVKQDIKKGRELLESAIGSGNPDAAIALGKYLYEKEENGASLAIGVLTPFADKDNAEARSILARIYGDPRHPECYDVKKATSYARRGVFGVFDSMVSFMKPAKPAQPSSQPSSTLASGSTAMTESTSIRLTPSGREESSEL